MVRFDVSRNDLAQRQRKGEGNMSSSKVVSAEAKDDFWAVVEDCLREFHGMKQEGIRRKATKLRNGIEQMTTSEQEYFYHSEPFDVACEIADNQLNVQDHLDRYLHVRDERHGSSISRQKVRDRGKIQE